MRNGITVEYWDGNDFNREFAMSYKFLSLLAMYYLRRYKIKKFRKMVIMLIKPGAQGLNDIAIKRDVFKDLIDVIEIWKDFDIDRFYTLLIEARRKEIWDIIFQNLREAASLYDADVAQVDAYREGLKNNLRYRLDFKEEAYSKSLKKIAKVYVLGNEESFDFYVSIFDASKNPVGEFKFASFAPVQADSKIYSFKGIELEADKLIADFDGKKYYYEISV